jgi:hypothetical protein
MRVTLIFILLSALPTIAGPAVDHRPWINPSTLDEREFEFHGLHIWIQQPSSPPPTNIDVYYIHGGDETSPTQRTVVLVAPLNETLPIFCVNATSEREVHFILTGFLAGYLAGLHPGERRTFAPE